ncbi:MAG: iron-containing alcohol dehydrogenase, partial [Lachnospiraceae bacterium]|nr:iron-containing alcohol dehydrogenase [Candidatus Equihabitans merdae]
MITSNYYAPTDVIFGENTESQAGKLVKQYGGSKVMIVYGGGSAKRSGLIDKVEASLDAESISYVEFGGVQPNPLLTYAEEGVRQAIAEGIDFLLPVGGGSAIDTAKGIAHGAANPDLDLWDIWTRKVELNKTLPVGVVLTIPAAGSEMSDSAVLTNEALGRKAGLSTPHNRCKFAIMNPVWCLTLPAYQKAAGIADIMMHTMERYFIPGISCQMTDEIAEGLLRTVIENGRRILADDNDVEAMGEVMWASSLSHNGLTGFGRGGDFSVHKLGHALSYTYGTTHGASLACVWKSWALYLYEDALDRFARFARKVWNITEEDDKAAALAGIEATDAFFKEIGMPVSLSDLEVS